TIGNAVNTTKPTNHGDKNANPAPASRRRDTFLGLGGLVLMGLSDRGGAIAVTRILEIAD
ncbi:hypothetical protein, partial [Isoptericola nanjingensis]|uniref:hypothetical protein n=1 Tax=Isoptericola nanjingensis TaxID=903413 RepID=UPI003D1E63D6